MNRRDFLKGASAAVAAHAVVCPDLASAAAGGGATWSRPEFHAFSRVFQFLRDPARAAALLKSCGYDGVEWTVRPGGFCEPADAARRMKELKAAAEEAGLRADNVVVSFLRGDDDGADTIAKAAADAGFSSFRGAYFRYDRAKTHQANMDAIRSGFDSLVALAERAGLKACYQNHSTYNKSVPLFGSLVWDLAAVARNYSPKLLGIQYDPMHVRAEGGPSWDHTLGAVAPWIDMVCLKDFHFVLDAANPKDWKRRLVPAGEGIVDFGEVKRLMMLEGVAPRFTVHYDYDFPEDEAGARRFAAADVAYYRSAFG